MKEFDPEATLRGRIEVLGDDPLAKIALPCGTCDQGSFEDATKEPEGFCRDSDCPGIHQEITVLEAQIRIVKQLRATQEFRTQELHLLQVEFNQQHKGLIESLCKTRNDCAQAESCLRDMTLKVYSLDPSSKKPAKGVSIIIRKSLKYDAAKVKDWALKTNPAFLTLEEGGFVAYALTLMKSKQAIPGLDPAVIEVVEKPHATIAKEL